MSVKDPLEPAGQLVRGESENLDLRTPPEPGTRCRWPLTWICAVSVMGEVGSPGGRESGLRIKRQSSIPAIGREKESPTLKQNPKAKLDVCHSFKPPFDLCEGRFRDTRKYQVSKKVEK